MDFLKKHSTSNTHPPLLQVYRLLDIYMTTWRNIARPNVVLPCWLSFGNFVDRVAEALFSAVSRTEASAECLQCKMQTVNSNHIVFNSMSLCPSSCSLSSPNMSASHLQSPPRSTLPPSFPGTGRTTETKSMAVTADASDESLRLQLLSQCWAEKWKQHRKKGFS